MTPYSHHLPLPGAYAAARPPYGSFGGSPPSPEISPNSCRSDTRIPASGRELGCTGKVCVLASTDKAGYLTIRRRRAGRPVFDASPGFPIVVVAHKLPPGLTRRLASPTRSPVGLPLHLDTARSLWNAAGLTGSADQTVIPGLIEEVEPDNHAHQLIALFKDDVQRSRLVDCCLTRRRSLC